MHPDVVRHIKRLGLMRDLTWGFAATILAVAVMDSAWPAVLHLGVPAHLSLDSGGYSLALLAVLLGVLCQDKERSLRGGGSAVVSRTGAIVMGILGTVLLIVLARMLA